jgi:uncharacterized protein YqgC (DUF456 family)
VFNNLKRKARLAIQLFVCDRRAIGFNIKGFALLAILVYGSFMAGDWLVQNVLGASSWGFWGTLVALLIPTFILYMLWKNTKFFNNNIQ